MTKIALALGGGGAAGLGHIPVLEAVDDLDIRPVAVAGVSAGALVGAAYCAGMDAAAIRDHVAGLTARRAQTFMAALGVGRGLPGVGINPHRVVDALLPKAVPERFEDLQTPLTVVASDLRTRRPVEMRAGPLREALAASIAIPGLFRVVTRGDHVLVDGGVTANLPIASLPPADVVLAADMATDPPSDDDPARVGITAAVSAMRIMMEVMVDDLVARHPPDVLIRGRVGRFRLVDYWNAAELLDQMSDVRRETGDKLSRALANKAACV
ncbi:MAG: patatin-like phospholipase family protein [Pseudomonadota bacterium]